MPNTLKAESTLTDRYQTTVPETVRRALNLNKRDRIRYSIQPGGEVLLSRAEVAEGDDPVLGQFLEFLARDMAKRPAHLKAVDAGLTKRLKALVGKVKVDLGSPLSADDE